MKKALALTAKALALLAVGLLVLWSFGAILYNGPLPAGRGNLALAVIWALATLALFARARSRRDRWLGFTGCLAVVMIPYACIRPSNDRSWQPEFARTGWTEIAGDRVTFHQFRNFDYTRDGQVTERWETRSVHLSNLRGADLFLDAFGGALIAHPIASFDFGPEGRVALSVETRRERGESFSVFGGLYKKFELQYLFGSEEDFVRVRTNVRHEPVYLYKIGGSYDRVTDFFLDSVAAQNRLRDQPKFYNVISANCTTSLRQQSAVEHRIRADWRLICNGKLDEMIYQHGGMAASAQLPFAELRRRSLINERAAAAHDDPDFCAAIRRGLPGF